MGLKLFKRKEKCSCQHPPWYKQWWYRLTKWFFPPVPKAPPNTVYYAPLGTEVPTSEALGPEWKPLGWTTDDAITPPWNGAKRHD